MLGRALNAGSGQAPSAASDTGLRATNNGLLARRIDVTARLGDPAGMEVPLVAATVRIAALEDCEFGLELRADAGGRPGAVMVPAMIQRFVAGFADWAEFPLPAGLSTPAGAWVWLVMRATRGTLLWHCGAGGAGEALVSLDQGASWGASTLPLGPPSLPLAQLFHAEVAPFARPVINLVDDSGAALADCFAAAQAAGSLGKSWSVKDAVLPAALLDRIAALACDKPGPRASLTLRFAAPSALELTIADLRLSYDPASGATG